MRKFFACFFALVCAASLPRQVSAQQAQSLSSVITDTVMNCLSPYGAGIQRGDKLMVLHFKAPNAALNDWAIGKFTEVFARQGAAAVSLKDRGAALAALSAQADTDFDASQAASYGAQAGVKTVITGAFSPSGNNWNLSVRAVQVSSKKTLWSKNYLVQPDAAFIALASQPAASQPTVAPQPAAAQPATAAQPAAGTGTITIRRDPVTGAITATGTGGVTATVVQPAQTAAAQQPAAAATPASGQTDDGWPLTVDNARNLSYLNDVEKDVILELNKVRTNPSRYAELYIKPRIESGSGSFKTAAQECYNNLIKLAARPLLVPEKGMCLGAKDHAKDMEKTNRFAHDGSDGSDVSDRISRYGKWNGSCGENCAAGYSTGREIIVRLCIDDGVAGRGHFWNNMGDFYRKVGVGTAGHKTYGFVCVIDFAGAYTSK